MLTAGIKRWFTYPPGALRTGPDRGQPLQAAADWASSSAYAAAVERQAGDGGAGGADGGAEAMRECPQRPGELFYLPACWAHQTVNIGGAVAGAHSISCSLLAVLQLTDCCSCS